MKMIPRPQISAAIMTLMADAASFVTIVSPYNKIASWDKLKRYLRDLDARNIRVEYFVRGGVDASENAAQLSSVGVTPQYVEGLHAKIYMNESVAIVSSMNLTFYSDAHSIDVAIQTTTSEEYREVADFVQQHVRPKASTLRTPSWAARPPSFLEELCDGLAERFPGKEVSFDQRRYQAEIRLGHRNFELKVERQGAHRWLVMLGILPTIVFDHLVPSADAISREASLEVLFDRGDERSYCTFECGIPITGSDLDAFPDRDSAGVRNALIRVCVAVYGRLANSRDPAVRREL